jgi:hypothetical protein
MDPAHDSIGNVNQAGSTLPSNALPVRLVRPMPTGLAARLGDERSTDFSDYADGKRPFFRLFYNSTSGFYYQSGRVAKPHRWGRDESSSCRLGKERDGKGAGMVKKFGIRNSQCGIGLRLLTAFCLLPAAFAQAPAVNIPSDYMANSSTVCDLAGRAGNGVTLSGDFSQRAVACLNAANNMICDGRGLGLAVLMSVSIATSKSGGVLMLPPGNITMAAGTQVIPWSGAHIFGSTIGGYGATFVENPSSALGVFYTPALVGGVELHHFQVVTHAPNTWAFNLQITNSHIHNAGSGGRGNGLKGANSGCTCYNRIENNNFEGYNVAMEWQGNFNSNTVGGNQLSTSTASTSYALLIDDDANAQINFFSGSIENANAAIYVGVGNHDNIFSNYYQENDGVLGSGSKTWLAYLASGALRNTFGSHVDVVDNSGIPPTFMARSAICRASTIFPASSWCRRLPTRPRP